MDERTRREGEEAVAPEVVKGPRTPLKLPSDDIEVSRQPNQLLSDSNSISGRPDDNYRMYESDRRKN
jgi:hypothetical protein